MKLYPYSQKPSTKQYLIALAFCGISVLGACTPVTPIPTQTITNPTPTNPTTTTPTPELPTTLPDTNTSNAALRMTPKVLVEKYTGFRCGNCPAGTDVIKDLEARNPNTLVSMSIHAGGLAVPSSAPFNVDLRTLSGTALDNQFRATSIGTPSGMVNRVPFNNSSVMSRGAWASAVAAQQNRTLDVAMSLTTFYNPTTRTVTARVEAEYLKAQEADNYLSFYIIEDSVVQAQTDYRLSSSIVPNYVHHNIVRGTINGTWGTQLSTGAIPAGTKITREASLALTSGWNERRSHVIAFVHKFNTSWQILQVEKARIQKK